MISIVNTECHVPKTFSDLAKIAAWGRLGQFIEQDAGDPFQLAALGGGKMIEAGAHGQRASGRSIAVMP